MQQFFQNEEETGPLYLWGTDSNKEMQEGNADGLCRHLTQAFHRMVG